MCSAEGRPEELFATSRDGDAALYDAEQLEQLQFESAAEGGSALKTVVCVVCSALILTQHCVSPLLPCA